MMCGLLMRSVSREKVDQRDEELSEKILNNKGVRGRDEPIISYRSIL